MRTEESVQKQLADAWLALEEDCEGEMPATLREVREVNPEVWAKLIEAMEQLQPGMVDQELLDLAGVKPVGEILGIE